MKKRVLISVLCVLAPGPAFAGAASDAVKFFYGPVRFEADPQYRSRFTEPATRLFELNDQSLKNPDGAPCIDFGPGIDSEGYDEKEIAGTLKLGETVAGDSATVTATFDLFPDGQSRREMLWELKNIAGKWKIADISSISSGWKLSELNCLTGQSVE